MVVTTLAATMNMMALKYVAMSGLFDVIGMMDDTVFRNMVRDSKIVTPRDNFSPESGGKVKSRTAMEDIRRQGTIRLKK